MVSLKARRKENLFLKTKISGEVNITINFLYKLAVNALFFSMERGRFLILNTIKCLSAKNSNHVFDVIKSNVTKLNLNPC
ncbi:hypothetical protein SAMN05421786_10334 [Chryseobacterium ureilyticum]|uniref:Uncharacterized protein n=1 Tax=Chryseobacterium ureilyticum TaxID=373668 RepID=A0A1N7MYC7_9FLAO|nr:hypothetical protein SAMN05421786_10334 [Chryseobacterium ureilyticum]